MARNRLSRPPIREIVAGGLCALCATLASGLVLYDLGARSLWVDEATTWGVARQHGAALWQAVLQDGGNMSGFYMATHFVVELFGSSPLVLRFAPALAFVATVPCCYLLVRRLFDPAAAVLASLLFVASEPTVYWAQQARGYLPAVFFVVAAALALTVAVQERSRHAWIWFTVLGALACYMLLIAGLAVIALLISLVLVPRRQLELRRVLVATVGIGVLCIPLAAMALRRGGGQLDWIAGTSYAFAKYLGRFALSAPNNNLVALAGLAAVVAGIVILVARLARHGRSLEAFAPGLLVSSALFPVAVMALVSWLGQPLLSDRYLLPDVSGLSILAGVGLSRLRPAPVGWVLCAALASFRLVEVPSTYGIPIETWSTATSYVLDHYPPGDCIAFFVADGFTAFDYYLLADDPRSLLPDPVLPATSWSSSTPFVLDPETLSPGRFAAVTARCPGLVLVYTHQAGEKPGPGVPAYQVRKQDAYDQLQRELAAAHFVQQRRMRFTGVDVSFLVRRSGG
jgi:hypothetical protein